MKATIRSCIKLSVLMPAEMLDIIRAELSVPNPKFECGGVEEPEKIALYSKRGDVLTLPRGYAGRLEQLAGEHGEKISWDSRMTLLPAAQSLYRDWPAPDPPLRDYQEPARDSLVDWASCLYRSPTGAGKSLVVLDAIRWSGQKALIIVGRKSLAAQWVKAAQDFYGVELGTIGEGKWDERDCTVAVWQTIWTRRDLIDPDWWASFGAIAVDEVQHGAAAGLGELVQRFPAFYRWGVSATPDWGDSVLPTIQAIYGPIAHQTTDKQVGDRLIKPRVEVVDTTFDFDFHGDYVLPSGRPVRNNYMDLQGALVADPKRNDLIAQIARREARAGHHVLIVTRRIEHVRQLTSRLEKTMKLGKDLHVLTGDQTGADAQRVAARIASTDQGSVLISTVADEGIDVPRLDRLIMAFPLRKIPLCEQQVGRIRRRASGKGDAVVIDLRDHLVGVLLSQHLERAKGLYMKRRWGVSRDGVEE